MINLSDEILNKYLDGELDESQSAEVRTALSSSDEMRKKFRALKLVHEKLSSAEAEKVSPDFTGRLMQRIGKKFVMPRQQKYFIISLSTIIAVICLVVFGYVLSSVLSSVSPGTGSQNILEGTGSLANDIILYIKRLFSGKNLSIIGSVFSLLVIISGYFFFETQKRSKATLGN